MEITVNVNINAPELSAAIRALAESLKGVAPIVATPTAVPPAAPVAPIPAAVPAPVAPARQAPAAVVPPAVAPPVTPIPTAVQTYTLDQLAVAATQLMDAGRRNELIALLGQFGVQALMALPKEQYGAFATQLRALGAQI